MPIIRIPGRDPGGGPPAHSVSLNAAAAPAESLARAGQQLRQFADRVDRKKKEQDDLDVFRERARTRILLAEGEKAIESETAQYVAGPDYKEEEFPAWYRSQWADLYEPQIAEAKNDKLRAELQGELDARLQSDLTAAIQANDLVRTGIRFDQHEAALIASFPLDGFSAGLRRLSEFDQSLTEAQQKYPQLKSASEAAKNRVSKALRSSMFARPGGEAEYYSGLQRGIHLSGDFAFDSEVFRADREVALSKLESGSAGLLRASEEGVSGPTLKAPEGGETFAEYEAKVFPSTPFYLDASPIARSNAQAAEHNNRTSARKLNAWVGFWGGGAAPRYSTDLDSQLAFTRTWSEQVEPLLQDGNRPLDERMQLMERVVREIEVMPDTAGNWMQRTIDAARGTSDLTDEQKEALKVAALSFAAANGNPILVQSSGSSLPERYRQANGYGLAKTKDLLDRDQINFLNDFLVASQISNLDAAVDAARKSAQGRDSIQNNARGEKQLLDLLDTEQTTFRGWVQEQAKKFSDSNADYRNAFFTDGALSMIRLTFQQELAEENGDVQRATLNTFNQLPRKMPVVDWMGQKVIDPALNSLSFNENNEYVGTRWLEQEVVGDLYNLVEQTKAYAEGLKGDELAAVSARLQAYEGITSRLDDPDFLRRISVSRFESDPSKVVIRVSPEVRDGEVVFDEMNGPIYDPRTGIALTIGARWEDSEANKLEQIESLAETYMNLEVMGVEFDVEFTRAGDAGDILGAYETTAAALDAAWMGDAGDFRRRWVFSRATAQPGGLPPTIERDAVEAGAYGRDRERVTRFLQAHDPDKLFQGVLQDAEGSPLWERHPGYRKFYNDTVTALVKKDLDERFGEGLRPPISLYAPGERAQKEALRQLRLKIQEDNAGKTLTERLEALLGL